MSHRVGWRQAIVQRRVSSQSVTLRALAIFALAIAGLLFASTTILAEPPAAPASADSENADPKTAEPRYETVSLRGKVVWLGDALKRRFGIELDPDDLHTSCALETADELLPLAKDARGRGFWLDERLRDCDVELLVRRYAGSPVLKVIRVYAIKPDGKYELDYWCNVCSIPMYELKACECCQGPTELRLRPAEDATSP